MTRTSIGVDYSATTIYLGCLKDLKVAATSSVEMVNVLGGFTILKIILRDYHAEYETNNKKVWIESPWVNGRHFPKSGLMLARTAAFLELATLELGLEPHFVHPLTWRKEVYGTGHPKLPKELARATAQERFGFDTKYKNEHNICEALLIAHYGNLQPEEEIPIDQE